MRLKYLVDFRLSDFIKSLDDHHRSHCDIRSITKQLLGVNSYVLPRHQMDDMHRGTGFGQKEGTSHLRIAFLPPKDILEKVLPEWIDFHNRFIQK